MPIIIRLQNLSLSANSLDIRRFFQGLIIPDGGVHIVGGKNGDAFIAFTNDEDARQAMAREGGFIKEKRIKLYLSSKNEMQQIIEQARSQNAQKAQFAVCNNQNPLPTNLKSLNTTVRPQFSKSLNETLINSQTEKLIQNYNGNNSGILLNLQEVPNYTRHRSRSPIDRARSRSNSPYSRLRINKLLDEVRKLDPNGLKNLSKPSNNLVNSLPVTSNVNGSTRSRLDPFVDLSTTNSQQSVIDTNRLNNSVMGGIMNPSFQNFVLNTNNAYCDDQLSLVNTLSVNNSNINTSGALINSGLHQISSSNINSFNYPIVKYTVELRGLPFGILPIDIQEFFRNFGLIIECEQIKILINDQGYTTGGAILKLKSEREFEQALLTHGRFLGNHRIEITPMIIENNAILSNNIQQNSESTINQNFNAIYSPINNNLVNQVPNIRIFNENRKKETFSMFMKGIPYNSCNEEDIEKFFNPIPIYDIVLIFERSGRPSGNAYVVFDSKQDFDFAMKRNKKYMGPRYIELFPVTEEEVEKHKNDFDSRSSNDSRKCRKSNEYLKNSYVSNVNTSYCIQIKGLPPAVNNRDLTNYFLEFGVQASAIHIMLKADGMNAGEAFVEFWTKDFLNKALRRDGHKIGNYRLSIKEVSYNKVCEIVGLPLNTRAKLVKTMSSGRNNLTSDQDYQDRRCIVIASNISNRANIGDICAFFQEFDLHRHQIDAKFNKSGLISDEVYIKFRSPEEAERAIRLMNKKYMIGKQIYLRSVV